MIETARLALRPFAERDRDPFAAMAADPAVMGAHPGPLTRSESRDLLDQLTALWAEDGFCYGAVERRADGAFLGMAGLAWIRPEAPLCPGFELGFALARAHWGQGYAAEAARAWIAHGFGPLALPEITAFADPANRRSVALLARLGFRVSGRRDAGPQQIFTLTDADWRAERSGSPAP
mgnify:CR=1 FL=1